MKYLINQIQMNIFMNIIVSESLNDYVRLTPFIFHFDVHLKISLITIDSNLKNITLKLPIF